MGFIEREITEEDKKWLEQFRIPNPFSSRFEPNYAKRIIEDKEEGAVLICLGGQGAMKIETNFYNDLPLVFYFIWNGYCLYVECHYEIYKIEEKLGTYGIKYLIEKIRNSGACYPERDTEVMKEKIKKLLKEALSLDKGYMGKLFEEVEFLNVVEPICL